MINLPAVILVVLCALLLIRGASESAKTNAVMVLIKIAVLVMFVVIGVMGWNADNLSDFAPFGFAGVTAATGIIFFSYIGLDAVSTAGEEVKNPRRTMPLRDPDRTHHGHHPVHPRRGRRGGRPAVHQFEGQEAGLSAILEKVVGASWPGTVVAAGAVISIFSVTLVTLYGQTRILFAMSRDGMVPELFHRVNRRTVTPVAEHDHRRGRDLAAGRPDSDQLPRRNDEHRHAGRVRVVSIGVMVLRRTHPETAARVQGAGVSGHADPCHHRHALDHQGPARRDDLGVPDLGCGGDGLVCRVRLQALSSRPPRTCRSDPRLGAAQ